MSKDLSAEIGFSFEAVLAAVQDSDRGRWFLNEFKKRASQAEAAKLMDAVSRIENRVEGMAGHFTAAEDLARVRQAIANTRADIAGQLPEAKGLSEEGKLFAHLADLARKAIPEQPQNAGIEKALRLVEQLDSGFSNNVMAFPAPVAKPADTYFQQDANVFEKKPSPAVAAQKPTPEPPVEIKQEKPVATKPEVEKVATGAKLTITRAGSAAAPAPTPAAKAEVKAEPVAAPKAEVSMAPPPVVAPKTEAATAPAAVVQAAPAPVAVQKPVTPDAAATEVPKPRIVIIRRKPEETPDLPAALASSAA